MSNFPHAIAIGASAGGVEALLALAAALLPGLPAIVLVTQHIGTHASLLPELMRKRGRNPAQHARDGDVPRPGTIYIAPPDRHLIVEGGRLCVSRGPKENHCRPAIDPMFRSVALAFGACAIGVVLTGSLDDGAAGLKAMKECGGIAIVQDPRDGAEPGMPQAALDNVDVDYCVPLVEIAPLFDRLLASRAFSARLVRFIEEESAGG